MGLHENSTESRSNNLDFNGRNRVTHPHSSRSPDLLQFELLLQDKTMCKAFIVPG